MIEWVNRGNYQGREPETEFFVRKFCRIGKEKFGFFVWPKQLQQIKKSAQICPSRVIRVLF